MTRRKSLRIPSSSPGFESHHFRYFSDEPSSVVTYWARLSNLYLSYLASSTFYKYSKHHFTPERFVKLLGLKFHGSQLRQKFTIQGLEQQQKSTICASFIFSMENLIRRCPKNRMKTGWKGFFLFIFIHHSMSEWMHNSATSQSINGQVFFLRPIETKSFPGVFPNQRENNFFHWNRW